jgi:hypothetical protein
MLWLKATSVTRGIAPSSRLHHGSGRRWWALLSGVALLLPSCGWDGQLTILGYTTKPNYDLGIKTVRVPIFENATFRKGLEFQLTRAVIREIEAKTPYKVVSAGCPADTELTGRIVYLNKLIVTRNQLNEVREAETDLAAEIVWRDLRTGEILSSPKPRGDIPPPPPGAILPPPKPVTVTSQAGFIEEIGQTLATAEQDNVNKLAVQIVSQMEKPW